MSAAALGCRRRPKRSTKSLTPLTQLRNSRSLKDQRLTENMIPLIPALVLAFVSFIASAFVILRIVIPILPPHPLSKRVSPVRSFLGK